MYQQSTMIGPLFFVATGVALVAGWLTLTDSELATSILGSRSPMDWVLLGGFLLGAAIAIGNLVNVWRLAQQFFMAGLGIAIVGALVLAVAVVLRPSAGPPAEEGSWEKVLESAREAAAEWQTREGSPVSPSDRGYESTSRQGGW